MAAFPDERLDLKGELQLGGSWVDITSRIYTRESIQTRSGTSSEGSRLEPSACSLLLNNKDGRFSPRNPTGPYHGLLGRNTPLRITIPSDETYLALNGGHVSTPNSSALDITGDLDLRLDVTLDDWLIPDHVQVLIAKWDVPNLALSYRLIVNTAGGLSLSWSSDGGAGGFTFVDGPAPVPAPSDGRICIRATLDVDDGAGNHVVTFYTAASMAGPWEQLGEPIAQAGATAVASSPAPLLLGDMDGTSAVFLPAMGRLHAVEVRDGIDGPLVAAPDFSTQAPGVDSFTDSEGLDWTLEGATEITDREGIFAGEVSSWPPRWTPSGRDVWVPIQAAGPLRRLGQGRDALESTLRRRVPSYEPLAYWPLEDGADASQAASPIPGVAPLSLTRVNWASADSLPSSKPLPVLASNGGALAQLSGAVPAPADATTGWHVEWIYRLDSEPTTLWTFMRILTTGTVAEWYIQSRDNLSRVLALDSDGGTVFQQDIGTSTDLFNQWVGVNLRVEESGGTVTWWLTWQDVGGDAGEFSTSFSGTAGRVTGVASPPDGYATALDGMAIGHIGVFSTTLTNAYIGAITGYAGESAIFRLRRLALEEPRLALAVVDGDVTVNAPPMGPQRPIRLLDLVQECVDVDGGVLYERPDRLGLVYRDRSSLYNQQPALTLDYAARQIVPPLEPVDDDRYLRNDVTVSRVDGTSARAVAKDGPLSVLPPEDGGVGIYHTSVTLNLANDNQPEQHASWAVHLGTWDEARYPSVRILLHKQPQLIPAVLRLRVGALVRIVTPPVWTGPGPLDLLVQRIEHRPRPRAWEVTLTCRPAGPYRVGVVEDEVLGRADTDGSELASAVSSSATTMYVATTAGPRWVDSATYPDDFPIDLRVGGEVVTATAAGAPGAEPMMGDGDASTTAATDHVAPSVSAPGAADLLVCAWIPWDGPSDVYTVPGSMTEQAQTAGTWSRFADATEVLSGSGATGTRTATRLVSHAWAAVSVVASGAPGTTPTIEEHLEGVSGASAQVTLTSAAGTQEGWWLLALHAWDNGGNGLPPGPDGEGWQLVASSALAHADAPNIVAYARRVDAAGAQQVDFPGGTPDDNQARLYVLSGVTDLTAQALTVTRSVNGIAKPHAARADIRLAHPAIIAL
ncbi:hypothetical protein [Streptomyces sp. PR69]|uniref:hypothetical protein n=1 Tax=Streptomyces sp. PR69 TaxID=2984950 RepID=UPI00226566B4|nr:hypothetical protein [Streptomyces sp. PR69]